MLSLSQSRFSGTMEALEEDKCEGGHHSSESLALAAHEITFPCSAKLFRALWHQIMDCWGQRNGGGEGGVQLVSFRVTILLYPTPALSPCLAASCKVRTPGRSSWNGARSGLQREAGRLL